MELPLLINTAAVYREPTWADGRVLSGHMRTSKSIDIDRQSSVTRTFRWAFFGRNSGPD